MLGEMIHSRRGPDRQRPRAGRHTGFGLVELMVTMSVIVLLVGLALPRMNTALDHRRLQAAVMTLYNDLRGAAGEALRRNAPVYYAVTPGAHWCYSISTSSGCGCASAQACQLTRQDYASFPNVVLSSVSTAAGTFVPSSGLVAPTTVLFASASGTQARIDLGLAGSLSLCAPASGNALPDYPPC